MALNRKNEFKLRREGKRVYASRYIEDEYDVQQAIKLVDDTFNLLGQMEEYIENFEVLLDNAIKNAKENAKRETRAGKKVDPKFIEKLEEQWRNQLNITKETELPKLKVELLEYIKLARDLNCPIPDNVLELEE